MSTLIVLLGSFAILTVVNWVQPNYGLALGKRGRLALAIMFIFTGISHFFFTEEMMAMLPPFVPAQEMVVYSTGVLEVLGGLGLLIQRTQRVAGYALIAFLLAVLPANIYAALNYTGMGGHVNGPAYLWFRVPLQIVFIGWAWYFTRAAVEMPSERTSYAT